ncbi:MAG: DsrE family protein [Candidatus Eremiobacteraeota bacterium]|nr:DsrE family protein [Candidatus Eremiobacteraeota bacterium]
MANFGFIINRSPFVGGHLETLYGLADAALEKEHQVFIFLNNDSVIAPLRHQKSLEEGKSPKEIVEKLIQRGAEVILSDLDLKMRGLDRSKFFIDGVKTGGLPDIAEAIADMDKLITL